MYTFVILTLWFLMRTCILLVSSFMVLAFDWVSVIRKLVLNVWYWRTRASSVGFRFYDYDWEAVLRLLFCYALRLVRIQMHRLIFHVTASGTSRTEWQVRLLLQRKLPPAPTGAEFMLLLLNLWRLWVPLVQTGVPQLVDKPMLIQENLLITWLWEVCKEGEKISFCVKTVIY